MSLASLYAGLCISTNRTSICHSISYPLTANFKMPHGLACAVTMMPVIKFINKKNKNFFKSLIKELKFKNYEQFEKYIESFFKTIKLKSRSKEYIKNQKDFISLSKEMYTQGRADNFKFKVNDILIKKILRDTFKWIYN